MNIECVPEFNDCSSLSVFSIQVKSILYIYFYTERRLVVDLLDFSEKLNGITDAKELPLSESREVLSRDPLILNR